MIIQNYDEFVESEKVLNSEWRDPLLYVDRKKCKIC